MTTLPDTPPIAFGPVASRRLGRSLGVNNIPPKHCSYSCVYCQAGHTTHLELERRAFHPPAEVIAAVRARVTACAQVGQPIDWITFAPDGEPTLDEGLGEAIRGLSDLRLPIAVFTNGSLLWRADVRRDLAAADLVSVKVDAVREGTWRRVDRSSRGLPLPLVLEGMRQFAHGYRGRLVTETMLVRGAPLEAEELDELADFVGSLRPAIAYLAVPTRPPAEASAAVPGAAVIALAREAFEARLRRVELLAPEPSADVLPVLDPAADLEGILAVHPMREREVRTYLARVGIAFGTVEDLLASGRVARTCHGDDVFYVPSRTKRRSEPG